MTLYFLDYETHCGGEQDGIWLWDSANVLEQVTRSLHLAPSAFLAGAVHSAWRCEGHGGGWWC